MGSSPFGGGSNNNNNINNMNNSNNSCCDMTLKCWCRWKWDHCYFSTSFFFFLTSVFVFVSLVSLVSLYGFLFFSPFVRLPNTSSLGCQDDNQGSWSIGVYYGHSPFNLKPIESRNVWRDDSAAWPIANPVLTCASPSDAGFPSNFVADPFLFVQGDTFYMFYESKNSITLHGDIGVARSIDKGVTWQKFGIALDEEWHLSYPYVFDYNGQIYMMPESSQKGELRLYRALEFPLKWTLDRVIMKKALVDCFIINYNDNYWLFGSDHSGFGNKKNGQLKIWYSDSPLGPWKPHKHNPSYNIDKGYGLRNGGRPFMYDGSLYRVGQDCETTYRQRTRIFKVEVLTTDVYKEVEVPLSIEESEKGRNAWNGARHHHLDVQKIGPNEWVGLMDGDRVLSGDSAHRFILGSASVAVVALLIILVGVLVGPAKCILPFSLFPHGTSKRSDTFSTWDHPNSLPSKLRWFCTRFNRTTSSVRSWVKPNTCAGRVVLILIFITALIFMCMGVGYIYGGNGAEEAYLYKDHYSQFTLVAMTYDARLWNLKMYVKHYSRCSSVREIVVVWNKGNPPDLSEFDSVVPVRIRIEEQNSLNNRFKVDPMIKTRAVLELDDDIMMTCDDVERGFRVWREYPERIVGFYPRLVDGSPLKYRNERYARTRKGYNMILTGAAFIDSKMAFERYWSDESKEGRELVDKYFNCEDVLLNFLYANASSSKAVEYVKPAWAIDTSKFSGVAISKNTQVHYNIRSNCIRKFTELYGNLANWKWDFDSRKDGWDV